MTLKSQNDIVTVETHFKDLGNPVWCKLTENYIDLDVIRIIFTINNINRK